MKRILGMAIGVVWLGFSYGAFMKSSAGWADGHGDLGFWWAVIAVLLGIAALGAVIGTWIHTQPTDA